MRLPATSLREVALPAGCCAAAAAALVRAALRGDPALRVPPGVASLAAAALAIAALALVARGLGRDRAAGGFAGLLMLAMASVGAWLALGPGVRACTSATGAPALGGALGCRLAFGTGAAITAALALWALAGWARGRRGAAARRAAP